MEHQSPEQREALWRRKLTEAERVDLRGQPELELEARLTDALARMSDVPVPSNFTARVLNAVDLEEAQTARTTQSKWWRWDWHALLPRMAVAMAALLFAGIGFQRHEAAVHRAEMAKSLSMVASARIPNLDALNDFDAIQRMSQSTHADTELIADLQ